MAKPSDGFVCVSVALLLLLLINPLSCNAQPLFVFGDSVYDTGNAYALRKDISRFQTGYPPYGKWLVYPTGKFSDGLIIIDFLAAFLGIQSPPPYYKNQEADFSSGANFANYGAGVLTKLNDDPLSKTLQEQYDDFRSANFIQKKSIIQSSAFVFAIGRHDYAHPKNLNGSETPIDAVIDKIIKIVKNIYEIGGRKFAFQNLGPLGCLPYEKFERDIDVKKCDDGLSDVAKRHNEKLKEEIKRVEKERKDLEYAIFDYYGAIDEAIQNPDIYGLLEVHKACCGSGELRGKNCGTKDKYGCSDPSKYLYWDGAHNTHEINNQLASIMWNGTKFVDPQSFRDLFAGVFDPMD